MYKPRPIWANQITIKASCVRKIKEIIVKAMPTDNQLWLLVFLPALAMASPPKTGTNDSQIHSEDSGGGGDRLDIFF
jgi:hypothetical protein